MLDHPHIVAYYGFENNATMYDVNGHETQVGYIVQELLTGGDLFDHVNTHSFSEDVCRYIFKQTLQAVNYIHCKGFAHRDLKPDNIMFNQNYDVKIVDFGFTCPLEGPLGIGTFKGITGTRGYMAPEIVANEQW
jgi:serine/threonine protein kinase